MAHNFYRQGDSQAFQDTPMSTLIHRTALPFRRGPDRGAGWISDISDEARRSPYFSDHEMVIAATDAAAGLDAVIAIHDRRLGPALGGCRMLRYPDRKSAIDDVLRLSRGMTFKAAMAGLPLGGGKAIIIGDSRADKTAALFRAFGRAVEALAGSYITAEDVGVSPRDMDWIAEETRHVAGTSKLMGDPSPLTAYGVLVGIEAALRLRLGHADLDGIRVAVQGLGHVGYALCRLLAERGARLIVADIDPEAVARAVSELGAEAVAPDCIVGTVAEVFAPCALGAVLHEATIPELRCEIVAGSANNQLASPDDDQRLVDRDILYVPDYVANAGGVINIAEEPAGYDRARAWARIEGIHDTVLAVLERSRVEGIAPGEAADRHAETRIATVGAVSLLGTGRP